MKRLLDQELQEDEGPSDEWWSSKSRKQVGRVFIRSGKPSKVQGPGLLQCAECGSEVKVLVSPRRNPHSSKLGRAVSMKDHDLCRRCWRRLMQHARMETESLLHQNFPATLQPLRSLNGSHQELPKTGT